MRTRLLVIAAGLCTLPIVAAAQSAPDRGADVAQITRAHPEIFGSDEARREGLKTIVCGLNQSDGGNWGRLVKTDQGGKIPADIIVWRPSREHFDVLTDSGPFWEPKGAIDPNWQWSGVDCAFSPPPPPPPPPANPPPTLPSNAELVALVEKIIENQQQGLVIAKDTNARVANLDRTIGQTLGAFSKFAAKYIAPAALTWYLTHSAMKDAPAEVQP